MPRITDKIHVNAPPEEVFAYLARPDNHLEIMPSLVSISNVEDLDNGGTRGDFTFKMLGARLDGTFEDTVFDPPHRREYQLRGDIEGLMTYTLEADDGATTVTLVNDAEGPGPDFLDLFTDPLVKRYLTREMSSMAQNLKMIIEQA